MSHHVVVLDNAVITSLAQAPPSAAVARCLSALNAPPPPPKAGCAPCARNAARAAVIAAAKACLLALPQAERDSLKASLRATTVVITLLGPDNKVVSHSF